MSFLDALAIPAWEQAKSELIRPISKGCLGPIMLGRLTASHGASRLVTLRGLGTRYPKQRLAEAAKLAMTMRDPRLTRVLGLCSAAGAQYLASDPVRGLPALELCRALRAADASVIQEVALRLALDTLSCLKGAKDEASRVGARMARRNVYPDTVWITPEGELQLSEIGVSELIATGGSEPRTTAWCPPSSSDEAGRDDVFAVGAFLYELLTTRAPPIGAGVPAPKLAGVDYHAGRVPSQVLCIVHRALSVDPAARFRDGSEMAHAIEALPMDFIASDRQVRSAIELLIRTSERPEDESGLTSGEQPLELWDLPTRSLKKRG